MLKRIVIKEELVELTGDFRPAIILNQFIYWTERMKDTDKYIEEEINRASKEDIKVDIDKSYGWIYKTSEDLVNETMLGMSVATMRKYIKQLVEAGFLNERKNPKYKWDKTMQYRVDIYKVQLELAKLGYALEGYKLLPNIRICENTEEMKKASVDETEAQGKTKYSNRNNPIDNIPHGEKKGNSKNCKTYNGNKSNSKSAGKKDNSSYNPNKTKFHDIGHSFSDYSEDELEKLLLESQRGKFSC